MPRWLGWVIAAVVLVWIISNPAGAGNDIRDWLSALFTFGKSVSS